MQRHMNQMTIKYTIPFIHTKHLLVVLAFLDVIWYKISPLTMCAFAIQVYKIVIIINRPYPKPHLSHDIPDSIAIA